MKGYAQILILDCLGDVRPAICFSLELSGYAVRVVTEADEAINLLATAKVTGDAYEALLINNPCADRDIEQFMSDVLTASAGIPLVFVSNLEELESLFTRQSLASDSTSVFYTKPLMVKSLLAELKEGSPDGSLLQAGRYG